MPRLVSLVLLSVLALPAAALLYTLTVVIGEQFFWRWSPIVWLTANVGSFGMLIVWWTLLWWRSVEWTGLRIALTLLATAGSVMVGVLVYLAVNYRAYGGLDFSATTGGATAALCWLVCACVLWRSGARPGGVAASGHAASTVICPRCSYALNGLREARCPECGEVYTLDALLLAQPALRTAMDLGQPEPRGT